MYSETQVVCRSVGGVAPEGKILLMMILKNIKPVSELLITVYKLGHYYYYYLQVQESTARQNGFATTGTMDALRRCGRLVCCYMT